MKHAPAADVSAKPLVTDERPVLVFDSGIGGLTVLRELRVMMPDRRFVYIADDAGFLTVIGKRKHCARELLISLASSSPSMILKSRLLRAIRPRHWCWMICAALILLCHLLVRCLRSSLPLNVRRRGLFPFWQRRAQSNAPIHATLSSHSPRNAMCDWWELTGLQALRKPIFAVKRSMRRWLLSRSRRVLSKRWGTDGYRRVGLHALPIPRKCFPQACAMAGGLA